MTDFDTVSDFVKQLASAGLAPLNGFVIIASTGQKIGSYVFLPGHRVRVYIPANVMGRA